MSTQIGRQAEEQAALFLKSEDHKVLHSNWRTRWCEIDIVSSKAGIVYFVEVKYRASSNWGSGLEYITPTKLKQMQFAADFWIANHKANTGYRLAAIELSGEPPRVTEWLDDII